MLTSFEGALIGYREYETTIKVVGFHISGTRMLATGSPKLAKVLMV